MEPDTLTMTTLIRGALFPSTFSLLVVVTAWHLGGRSTDKEHRKIAEQQRREVLEERRQWTQRS